MKHFLPSSVMLTPFVVKKYPDPKEDESEQMSCDRCDTQPHDSDLNLPVEKETSVTNTPTQKQPRKE